MGLRCAKADESQRQQCHQPAGIAPMSLLNVIGTMVVLAGLLVWRVDAGFAAVNDRIDRLETRMDRAHPNISGAARGHASAVSVASRSW